MPSFNDMIVKACALALREFPLANGAYKDGRFELYSRVNVGRRGGRPGRARGADRLRRRQEGPAGDRDRRPDAGRQSPRRVDHAAGALRRHLHGLEPRDVRGLELLRASINSPQAAILAVGAITEKPVVRDGEITTAHLLGVTLACDHRILYGAPAAEFLARIRSLLEEPLSLAL